MIRPALRAYRWGEDGLAGICDSHQVLCFALALWNGADPILKERLFGLTNSEGNHGEDVGDYFYLDSTPTHSYMKYLYKYPQAAYPYDDLVATNRQRSRRVRVRAHRHGHLRRQPLFRRRRRVCQGRPGGRADTGSASTIAGLKPLCFTCCRPCGSAIPGPGLRAARSRSCKTVEGVGHGVIHAHHTDPLFQESLHDYDLYCEGQVPLLFTENKPTMRGSSGTRIRAPT